MEYALLRSLRALGPGLLILAYVDLFLALVLGKATFFWDLGSAKYLLIGYVVGGIWGSLTFAFPRDRYAFRGVNDNTIELLSEFIPEVRRMSWQRVSPCFYALIDSDKSLEQKSKGVYFNGFIVTTSYEAIAISLFAETIGVFVDVFTDRASYLIISGMAVLASYMIWRCAVKKHNALIKSQVNVINVRLIAEFSNCLGVPSLNAEGKKIA